MDHLRFASDRYSMSIIRLDLMKIDGYQNQVLRPYVTTINGNVINGINNILDNYNNKIPTNAISSLCSNFIAPSSRPETFNNQVITVGIPNNWNENRFVFNLVVEISINGLTTTEVITGYTNKLDVAKGSHGNEVFIAPDTVFYINNIATISSRNNLITDSKSIIGGGMGIAAYGNLNTYKMSPSQLINSSKYNFADTLSDIPNNTYIATDNMICNTPTMTNRLNNSPNYVFSKILESYRNVYMSSHGSGFDNSVSDVNLIDTLRSKVSDPINTSSSFLYGMSNIYGAFTSTFDYKFLIEMDQFIESKTFIRTVPIDGMNSSYWGAADLATQTALIVSNMVTNLLVNYSLSVIEFSSTNKTPMGYMGGANTVNTQVYNIGSLTNNQTTNDVVKSNREIQLIGMLESIINDELIPIVSKNNQVDYTLHVKAIINLDVEVQIAYENEPLERFVFPSFADALLSPILTTNSNIYRKNSNDIGKVLQVIENNTIEKIDPYNEYSTPTIPMDFINPNSNNGNYTFNNQQW